MKVDKINDKQFISSPCGPYSMVPPFWDNGTKDADSFLEIVSM